jgi:hypothetical protein
MNDQELQIGDLIFYYDTLGCIEHTAVYVQHKNNIPYVVHSTSSPYNSVMLTHIKPAEELCSYTVMRPKNTHLAALAVNILLRWVEHQVPFACKDKLDKISNEIDNKNGFEGPDAGKIQESHGKQSYKNNYNQYIDMANALPYIPCEDGEIKGLRCAEAVISAYNIALFLMSATLKRSLIDDSSLWVIGTCNSLEIFIELLNNPLPFDAKATLSAGIYEHCVHDTENWISLGALNVANVILEEQVIVSNKESWREFRNLLKIEAIHKVITLLDSPYQKSRQNTPIQFASEGAHESSPSWSECSGESRSRSRSRSRSYSIASPFRFLSIEPSNILEDYEAEVIAMQNGV